ncbi:hypothetical protein B0T24DRAFT_98912 [Lasiosphaeria ovina]|uniref:Uncharacterized protein n=1 Tax=Lasiosphaeria ovina TaxID=92902 RepID=A0AAE0JU97_9PEZI|nr:hypothetical protein B0T24DRAFT_98912 [Lasiosphaeria ovina]
MPNNHRVGPPGKISSAIRSMAIIIFLLLLSAPCTQTSDVPRRQQPGRRLRPPPPFSAISTTPSTTTSSTEFFRATRQSTPPLNTNTTGATVTTTDTGALESATIWTTVPMAQVMTMEPFCVNAADPDQGIGNHCVCKNGATLTPIPYSTGKNLSDYQPCAYTTVDLANTTSLAAVNSTVTTAANGSAVLVTPGPRRVRDFVVVETLRGRYKSHF